MTICGFEGGLVEVQRLLVHGDALARLHLRGDEGIGEVLIGADRSFRSERASPQGVLRVDGPGGAGHDGRSADRFAAIEAGCRIDHRLRQSARIILLEILHLHFVGGRAFLVADHLVRRDHLIGGEMNADLDRLAIGVEPIRVRADRGHGPGHVDKELRMRNEAFDHDRVGAGVNRIL